MVDNSESHKTKQRTQTKLFCLHPAAVKLVALLLKFRCDRLMLSILTHTSYQTLEYIIMSYLILVFHLSVGCPATMADTHPSTSQCTIGHHLPPWPRPWPLTPCSLAKQLFALFTCQSGLRFTNSSSSPSLLLFTLCNFNYRSIVSASQVPIFRVTVSIFLAGP